jgi:hypothetical protein
VESRLKSTDEKFGKRVSKTLEQALGVTVMNLVFIVLKRDFGIAENEIAVNPKALKQVLERFFGPESYAFLEKLISREIITEFELPEETELENSSLEYVLDKAREKACLS